jgi:hypothetical protein
MVNSNVINSPKLTQSKNWIIVQNAQQEDAIQYLTKTIHRTFPDINLLHTTANEIKNIINSLKSTHVVMMEYQQNYSKL